MRELFTVLLEKQVMHTLTLFKTFFSLLLITASVYFVSAPHAAQPLTESDLGNVSAEIGPNFLNIFGAPAAGVSDDVLTTDTSIEGEETDVISSSELEDIEIDQLERTSSTELPIIDSATAHESIEASVRTNGQAEVFDTSSEIQFLNKDFHHELEVEELNQVTHTRDLSVDMLKLENLKGDHDDPNRHAGSIYISDWHSRGFTRIHAESQ